MPLIPKPKSKPKNGTYQCLQCQAHTEGTFSPEDTVFCYLCGNQMMVKDMTKIEKPKEIKIKPLNSGITGSIIRYDYGPDAKGQMKVSNITRKFTLYRMVKVLHI